MQFGIQIIMQNLIQTLRSIILLDVQIQMQNRISDPVLFQLLHRQTFKQLLLTLKVSFQGRDEQALSETSRTAQEVVTSGLYHLVHPGRFINIEITVLTDFLEILDSDGIYFIAHTFFNGLS